MRSSDGVPAHFSGRPSVVARIIVAALRLVRGLSGVINRALRREADAGASSAPSEVRPPRIATLRLTVRRSEFEGWDVYAVASARPSSKRVIAIHGGAYVAQPTLLHWFDYAALARDTGATVIVPLYPLAPAGTADTVVPLMADFIAEQVASHGAGNVSLYGDSAGGGLALAAAQEFVRRNDPRPAHVVLVSPWLDVTLTNPAIASVRDPVLNVTRLKRDGLLWAGGSDPTDPRVSPLYGSLSGLPPAAVYAGSLDVLSPDVLVLQEKALATAGAKFTFILRKGEIHNWAMGGLPLLPEAVEVRPDIYRQLGLKTE